MKFLMEYLYDYIIIKLLMDIHLHNHLMIFFNIILHIVKKDQILYHLFVQQVVINIVLLLKMPNIHHNLIDLLLVLHGQDYANQMKLVIDTMNYEVEHVIIFYLIFMDDNLKILYLYTYLPDNCVQFQSKKLFIFKLAPFLFFYNNSAQFLLKIFS